MHTYVLDKFKSLEKGKITPAAKRVKKLRVNLDENNGNSYMLLYLPLGIDSGFLCWLRFWSVSCPCRTAFLSYAH